MPADRLLHPKCGHSQKVTGLSSDAYRVWTQYLLSADDFGLMRAFAVKLQADNDYLAGLSGKVVQRLLDTVIASGLVRTFEHQGSRFIYQPDWQDWQKVTYPAKTLNPLPPPAALEDCSPATRLLFSVYPGAAKVPSKNYGRTSGELLENSESSSEELLSTRAHAPAKRLRANGIGLRANGIGLTADAPLDGLFRQLLAAYPAQAVTRGHLTESSFVQALLESPDGVPATFSRMLANLENQKAGHQWRVKRMIPRLDRWIREGLWEQQHDATPPETLLSEKSIRNLTSEAQFLSGGGKP